MGETTDEDHFTSSDEDDAFFDHFFEELGVRANPQDHNDGPSAKTNRTSDDQENEDNSDSTSSLALGIPSIFLTEGERNRRILQQDREISKQLAAEDEKNKIRLATFENEKNKIMDEINDNGSSFIFSWKNDSAIIEDYVQRSLSKDLSLVTSRQFYFFNDIQYPKIENKFVRSSSAISMALKFSSGKPDRVLQSLNAASIPLSTFFVTGLATVCDIAKLTFIEKIIRRSYELQRDCGTETLLKIPSFLELMSAIGARTVEPAATIPVDLKLVHYNNHTQLLLLRLSIVFHYCVPRATSKNEHLTLLQYFYLSCSDFHLNKTEKEGLRKKFVGPVFELLIHEWTRRFGSHTFVGGAHATFSSISPTLFKTDEVQPQKAFEIHFNMLLNLLHSGAFEKPTATLVKDLVFRFLDVHNPEDHLDSLAKVIQSMAKLTFLPKQDLTQNNRMDVYKNFYKSRLIAVLINTYVLSDPQQNGEGLFICLQELLDCKQAYQSMIGHLSFSSDDIRDKSRLTLVLSDTYHTLDYMVTVLNKSGVLPDRDFFYDK